MVVRDAFPGYRPILAFPNRRVLPARPGVNQLGVAHKTAPCGTLISFRYAGRAITVPVIDRGPFIAGREWDLTGATAAALGFPGLGSIEWWVAQR